MFKKHFVSNDMSKNLGSSFFLWDTLYSLEDFSPLTANFVILQVSKERRKSNQKESRQLCRSK